VVFSLNTADTHEIASLKQNDGQQQADVMSGLSSEAL